MANGTNKTIKVDEQAHRWLRMIAARTGATIASVVRGLAATEHARLERLEKAKR